MRSSTAGARVVVAVFALLVVAAAYADDRGTASDGITVSERRAVEAEIAGSRVLTKLEVALDEEFGGAWFAPATGRLHVGVPSTAGRRRAEAVAVHAGLGGIVVATPVRSTWAELEAAQERWAVILADLFDRAEVVTALRPQESAVGVELGSGVPEPRRAALEERAAADAVNVVVEASPHRHFHLGRDLRCNAFTSGKAYCDPTLVAGVTIQHEENSKEPCTAGPVVLRTDRSTAQKATERLVLTAGHCIDLEGKNKWFAFAKAGTKLEVGTHETFVNSHEGDIGVIPIKHDFEAWVIPGFIPVTASLALWGKAESNPIPVVASSEAFVNQEVCMSGQTTGTSCGKVLTLNQTIAGAKGMTEVAATRAGGDSGAPWYSQSYAESGAGLILGTHVGRNSANNNAAFQPLKSGLELLKGKGVDVDLLTENNQERRHPVLTAPKYPVTSSAKDATSEDIFTAFGMTTKCTENEFHGETTAASETVEVTPTYKACTSSLGLPVVFTNNSCKYRFRVREEIIENEFATEVDVVCPAGKPGLQFHIYANHTAQTAGTSMCTVTIPPQTGLGGPTLTNNGNNVEVDPDTIEAFKVKMHRNNFLCPSTGTEPETTTGVYHLEQVVAMAGTSGGGAVKIDIGGE